MKTLMEIREGEAGDVNFVLNSWIKSYLPSIDAQAIPRHVYFDQHHALIEAALARGTLYCAVSKEDRSQIYGYLCAEPAADAKYKALHYLYVKHTYRGFGIAKALLKHAFEEELFSFSHRPQGRLSRLLNQHGHYNPYRFFGGK